LVSVEPEEEGPWGKQAPDLYFPYRGQPPQGSLTLLPRPPQVRARCYQDVHLASGQVVVETHLLLEAEVGSPHAVGVVLSSSDGAAWQWDTVQGQNQVVRSERLPILEAAGAVAPLSASQALSAAALLAADFDLARRGDLARASAPEFWRLLLARPLRVR